MTPLNDTEVNTLANQGYREGDTVPGRGQLTPLGTFANAPTLGTALGVSQYDQLEGAKQTLLKLKAATDAKLNGTATPTPTRKLFTPGLGKEEKFVDSSIVDEKAIRRNQAKLFQGQINATNRIYDQMYREQRLEGEGRLGSTNAISARSGLLGSDFAQAHNDDTVRGTRQVLDSVQAERQVKIGEIMGKMREGAAAEIAAKRAAQKDSADALIKFNASKSERRSKNLNLLVQSLLDQGIDVNEVDEETIKAIQDQTGLTRSEITASYLSQKKAADAAQEQATFERTKDQSGLDKNAAEIRKIEADIASGKLLKIGEGDMLYNTETGATFKNPKTYAPSTRGGGGGGGLKVRDGTLSSEAVSDIHAELTGLRGKDGYTDTGKYRKMLDNYVTQLGGDPNNFVKEFSPDVYINPADPTRAYLQQYMKKTSTETASDTEELADLFARRAALTSGK